jgi:hypothetical protein
MTQVTVDAGLHKGRSAIVFRPTNAFRFMDLPPEIRLMIYKLLSFQPSANNVDLRVALKGRFFKDPKAYLRSSAITQVSKQVRSETLPLLYRGKTFIVDASNRCKRMIWYLQGCCEHVEEVTWDVSFLSNSRRPLEKLTTWTGLRTVNLRLRFFNLAAEDKTDPDPVLVLARAVLPYVVHWLRAFKRRKNDKSAHYPGLDVLSFEVLGLALPPHCPEVDIDQQLKDKLPALLKQIHSAADERRVVREATQWKREHLRVNRPDNLEY